MLAFQQEWPMLRGAFMFSLSAGVTYLLLAAVFALFCALTGHSTIEMLYGTTATFTLAAAVGMLTVWRCRS